MTGNCFFRDIGLDIFKVNLSLNDHFLARAKETDYSVLAEVKNQTTQKFTQ